MLRKHLTMQEMKIRVYSHPKNVLEEAPWILDGFTRYICKKTCFYSVCCARTNANLVSQTFRSNLWWHAINWSPAILIGSGCNPDVRNWFKSMKCVSSQSSIDKYFAGWIHGMVLLWMISDTLKMKCKGNWSM